MIIQNAYRYTPIEIPIATPITEPTGTPGDDEIIQYSGPRVYTDAPTYETASIQYIQPPVQYRLNTATSSISQITPQPISEIRHIINKVAAGTQTQPLGIANMEEIKTLLKTPRCAFRSFQDGRFCLSNPSNRFVNLRGPC